MLEAVGGAEQAQAKLRELAALSRRPAICLVEPMQPGGVAMTLLAVAGQRRCDVILLGAHGQPELDSPRLGRVTCGVLMQTQIPVQIVPQHREGACPAAGSAGANWGVPDD